VGEIRVVIVADDPLARAGLAALLAGQPDCAVVGQVQGGPDLVDEVAVYQPDVVLWDLGWDPEPGFTTLREDDLERLGELADSQVPVLVLLPDGAYAADAWTAGAQGALLRDTGVEPMVPALLAIAQGLTVLDQSLAATLLPSQEELPGALVEDLTPRELEVLQLLAEGLPNKTIAYQLGISEHTVKFHVNAILGKLGAQSRTEAVVRATRLGLIIL
jgi:two-component system nitrate/nitrite response regulator NarL